MSKLKVTIEGEQGSGKTLLRQFIENTLEDWYINGVANDSNYGTSYIAKILRDKGIVIEFVEKQV